MFLCVAGDCRNNYFVIEVKHIVHGNWPATNINIFWWAQVPFTWYTRSDGVQERDGMVNMCT